MRLLQLCLFSRIYEEKEFNVTKIATFHSPIIRMIKKKIQMDTRTIMQLTKQLLIKNLAMLHILKWKKLKCVNIKKMDAIICYTIEIVQPIKGALSGLKQFLAIQNTLKMLKNAFYFTLKALFVLKIFKLLSWLVGRVEKTAWLER